MQNETDVRWIPVGELGEVRMGKQLSPASRTGGGTLYPYLRVANVFDGYIDYSDVKKMRFTAAEREIYKLRPGDILLNEGQSLELVGRSAMYDNHSGEHCFQNHLIRFRSSNELLPRYAQAVFSSWLSKGVFASIAKRTTSIAHLGSDRFAALPFPLVPLPTQQRIIDIFESVDDAHRTTQATLSKLTLIRSATIENLAGAAKRPFSLVIASGPQNGLYKPASEYGITGTPIVRINSYSGGRSDFTRGLLRVNATAREASGYGLAVGDVLINRVNSVDLVGKATHVSRLDEPTVYESNLMRCSLIREQALPAFAEAWLTSGAARRYLRQRAKSAVSQASISRDDVLNLPFPDLDVTAQRSFLQRLEALDAQVTAGQAELAKLRQLKQGLADDLLGGRGHPRAVG